MLPKSVGKSTLPFLTTANLGSNSGSRLMIALQGMLLRKLSQTLRLSSPCKELQIRTLFQYGKSTMTLTRIGAVLLPMSVVLQLRVHTSLTTFAASIPPAILPRSTTMLMACTVMVYACRSRFQRSILDLKMHTRPLPHHLLRSYVVRLQAHPGNGRTLTRMSRLIYLLT